MARVIKITDKVSLPLDIVTQTITILAKRRVGKSYTMRRIVEQLLHASQQVVIIDPKGDQWGIRSSADGKKPGFPVLILGGEHGDLPLERSAGEVVAKLVVEEQVNILLDVAHFTKTDLAYFMAIFLENLYRLKAQEKYRTPMMLVVDEADAIAPQKPQANEARMLGAIDDIVRRGGQRGIGTLLITQRSAVLNKNVLTQSQMLVVLRLIAPQDMAAMKAWIDVHGTEEQRRELMSSVPALPVGDAYFWSPGWPTDAGIFSKGHVLPIETFDSAATPKPGQKRIVPKNLADVNLGVLQKQMAATIEKAKAEDPGLLKKRIVELEGQLRAKAAPVQQAMDASVIQRAVDAALAVQSKAFDEERAQYRFALTHASTALKKIAELTSRPEVLELVGGGKAHIARVPVVPSTELKKVLEVSMPAKPAEPVEVSTEGITSTMQKVLDAIAWMNSIGVADPVKPAVAFVAGYSPNTSGFQNACGALRSKGLVDYPGPSKISLTEAGRGLAQVPDASLSNEDLHRKILDNLSGPEREILAALIGMRNSSVTKNDLAAALNRSAGASGFQNACGRLRTLGLVEYPGPGLIKASDILFPL